MKLTIPPNPEGLPYLGIDFAECKLQIHWLTKEEKDRLDPNSRDAHVDLTNGIWSIQTEKPVQAIRLGRRVSYYFAMYTLH